jgi:mRNA interferase RelE/StbE
MRFEIILAPSAVTELRDLRVDIRLRVRSAIEQHLRHEPKKLSKSRIKRLRGLSRPQYRLRVDEIRVFYDVKEKVVEILAIIPKRKAESWLAQEATPTMPDSSGQGEG